MMCHSVEMYLPEMTRRAAEERLAEAAPVPARRATDSGPGLVAWLRARLGGAVEAPTREATEHG